MTPTHTPAAQPAGEMDDAALVEAMAKAIARVDYPNHDIETVIPASAYFNSPAHRLWESYVPKARAALAIARPVLQGQARRKALDEAAKEAICHSRYEDPYDTAHRIADAILALKDKPNG